MILLSIGDSKLGQLYFFDSKCPLTRSEIGSLILNIDDHNDFELSQEKMECHGTKLYTYTPKNETSSLRVVASTDKLTGVCASFLVTGLTKYEIVNKSTLEQFNVFYAFEPYFLKVIDRQLG